MINIDNFVKSKQITFLYKIINSEMELIVFFVNAPILKVQILHPFQNTIKTLYKLGSIFWGHVLRSLKMTFQIKTYLVTLRSNLIENHFFFQSFLRNNIFKINDIWDKNNNTFVENQTIFNRLDDKRNWISEWAKIKKSIPEN